LSMVTTFLDRFDQTKFGLWQQFFRIFRQKERREEKIELLNMLCEGRLDLTAGVGNLADYPIIEDIFMRVGRHFSPEDVKAVWECKYFLPKYWLLLYTKYLRNGAKRCAVKLLRENQELILILLLWSLFYDDSEIPFKKHLMHKLMLYGEYLENKFLKRVVVDEWEKMLDLLKNGVLFRNKQANEEWQSFVSVHAEQIRECLAQCAGIILTEATERTGNVRTDDSNKKGKKGVYTRSVVVGKDGGHDRPDPAAGTRPARPTGNAVQFGPDDPRMWLDLFSRPVRWIEVDPAVREHYLKLAEEAATSEKVREVGETLKVLAGGSFPIFVGDDATYSQMRQFADMLYRRLWGAGVDRYTFNVYSPAQHGNPGDGDTAYWDGFFGRAIYRYGPEYVLAAVNGNPGKEGVAKAGAYHVLGYWLRTAKTEVGSCQRPPEVIGILQSFSTKARAVGDALVAGGFQAEAVLNVVFKDLHDGWLAKQLDTLVKHVLEKMRALCPFRDLGWALERAASVLADMGRVGIPVGPEAVKRIEGEKGLARSLLCRLASSVAQAYRLKAGGEYRKKGHGTRGEDLAGLLYSDPSTERSVRRAWGACLKAWSAREFGLPPEGLVVRVTSSFLRACGYAAVRVKQQGASLLTRWWSVGGGSVSFRFVPVRDPKWDNPLEGVLALYALAVAVDACCNFRAGGPGREGEETRGCSRGGSRRELGGETGPGVGPARSRYPRSREARAAGSGSGPRCGGGGRVRRAYQVSGHFRRLLPGQKPSEEAQENALLYAGLIFLPEGFTFVRPHVRGGLAPGPDLFSATVYARSVAYLLDLCAAKAAADRGMDPRVFGFEVRPPSSGRLYQSFKRVGDPLAAAEGLRCSVYHQEI